MSASQRLSGAKTDPNFFNEINSTVGRTRTDTGSPLLDFESLFTDLRFLKDLLHLLEKRSYL